MHKISFIVTVLLFLTVYSSESFAQIPDASSGKQLYKSNCAACHSIGSGKLVGPDLAGIQQRRDEKWLINWIKSSQSMVKSGDKDAIALFNDYNKIVMTDFAFLKDDEIKSILSYIDTEGKTASASVTTPAAAADAPAIKKVAFKFSVFDYFFFSIAAILLIAVYAISRRIARWADEIGDMYENERAFYKK